MMFQGGLLTRPLKSKCFESSDRFKIILSIYEHARQNSYFLLRCFPPYGPNAKGNRNEYKMS